MQTISHFGITFLSWWLAAYACLAGTYLVVGWTLTQFNKRLTRYRIQSKSCSPKLVRRDFRQSLRSLITISALFAGGLTLRQMGIAPSPVSLTFSNSILCILASFVLFDTWFYWMHRLVHQKGLYRPIHRWHHRTITPTVWSNNSDLAVDNLLLQSYWFFAPLVLPIPTVLLIAHKAYDQITGMIGHAGYEYGAGAMSAKPSPMIGTTFHDQHHAHFNVNFATHFSAWDRLMGTLHPDYDRLVTSFPRSIPQPAPTTSASPQSSAGASTSKKQAA